MERRDLFDIFPDLPWPRIRPSSRAVARQVRDVAVKWTSARARTRAAVRRRDGLIANRYRPSK